MKTNRDVSAHRGGLAWLLARTNRPLLSNPAAIESEAESWLWAADAILAAGWVPGELYAAEQARNATLADTIQRVEAVLDEHDRTRNVRFQAGLHPGTSLIDPGIVRAILEADDQGAWLDTDEYDAYTPAAFRRDDSGEENG